MVMTVIYENGFQICGDILRRAKISYRIERNEFLGHGSYTSVDGILQHDVIAEKQKLAPLAQGDW